MKKVPRVKKFMTRSLHTIDASKTLADAHRVLRRHHIRHLPVLDRARLVGLVSERDLHLLETLKDVDPAQVSVREAMTPQPFCVGPRARLERVVGEMAAKKYGAAVVVDEGAVVGILTASDALAAFAALLHERAA